MTFPVLPSWELAQGSISHSTDQHSSLLHSKSHHCTPRLMQLSLAVSPHQRSISVRQMETITETHNWTQCSAQWNLGSPAPKDASTPQLLHPRLREHHNGGVGDPQSQNTGVYCETVSLRNGCTSQNRTLALSTDMLTQKGKVFVGTHPQIRNYRKL